MSSFRRLLACSTLVLLIVRLGNDARAQADDPSDAALWTVGVSALTDDDSSRNASVSLDVAVTEATWLSALAAQSRSPRARANVTADTLAFGVDHRFGLVGLRGWAERWGDAGAIESRDFSGAVYLETDRLRAELGLEQRDVDITATVTGTDGRAFSRKVPFSADGRSLDVRIDTSDRTVLRLRIEDFDYPPGLALLPRIDALNLLSTSTLTLANSFVSDVRSAGVEIELGDKLLGFGIAKDRSAIDGAELESIDAALMIPVGRRIDLELKLGRSSSDLFRSGVYGGLLVLIYGGG